MCMCMLMWNRVWLPRHLNKLIFWMIFWIGTPYNIYTLYTGSKTRSNPLCNHSNHTMNSTIRYCNSTNNMLNSTKRRPISLLKLMYKRRKHELEFCTVEFGLIAASKLLHCSVRIKLLQMHKTKHIRERMMVTAGVKVSREVKPYH